MERLFIEPTRSTPKIDFNPAENMLIIDGQSYPENSYSFYEPILEWLKGYLNNKDNKQININFQLPYINTSSSKCIMMILDLFESAYDQDINLILRWYCNEDNEAELECAEEFKEDYSFPFEIIPLAE